ncbi:uncharacterized protein LOC103512312 [Diaphorina citri]|uniref:Uncharacterized protein LOC103512312 n=1 Tax=Diaphorina citri TaxID=121845 RepID=A0A1S4EFB5_DIACI|nr:uncharacterized protein LOC103512312 [Diaphorina citri]
MDKSKKKKKRAASVAGTSSTQAPEKNQKELGEPNKDKKSNTNSAPSTSNTEISVAQNVSNVTNGGQKVKAVTKKKKTETVIDEKTKMLQDFQAVVREGTEFFLKDEYSRCVECYKRVRKDYGDVLRNICSPLDHSVFIYVFCMARIFTQSYLEIIDSLHDLNVELSFHTI